MRNSSAKRKIDKGLKKQKDAKEKKDINRKLTNESLRIKERLGKSLDLLEKNNSRLGLKKAENDLRKLRKLYPKMSDEEKKQISEMGKKLENLKKNE